MGEVIQLFKDGAPTEDFDATEVLTEEFQDELAATVFEIEALFRCDTRQAFEDKMAVIKSRVAEWPDGTAPDG